MKTLRRYEIMVLLKQEFTDTQLKIWVFSYVKNLRKFNVCEISIIGRGKHKLAYLIQKRAKANYLQLNFSSVPKYIHNYSNFLRFDSHVLRFLIFNKQK